MSSHDTTTFEEMYARRLSDDSPKKVQWRKDLWRVLVDDFFSRWIPEDATVLDFGCGAGEFINAVSARRRIGVDLRESVSELLDDDVEFFVSKGDWVSRIGEGSASVVFCSNLLEHLPTKDAVTDLFRDFHRVLAPAGRLLILGPNLRYTGPAYWDFFDHVLPLTHLSLAEALSVSGFRTETLTPRFLPYTAVGARTYPLAFVKLYLRLPLAWRFFGAQFFAVARP